MEDTFRKIVDNFIEFFKSLDMLRKVGLVALTGLVLSAMVGTIIWASRTQYKVLYTELNKDDALTIARILEEKNISYLLSDDNSTIQVPEDQVEVWRLELAKRGVNLTGTGGDNSSRGTN